MVIVVMMIMVGGVGGARRITRPTREEITSLAN